MCIHVDFRDVCCIAAHQHIYVLSRDYISCEKREECIVCGCFSCRALLKNNRANLMMITSCDPCQSQIFSKAFLLISFCVSLTICTEELLIFSSVEYVSFTRLESCCYQHFGNSVVSGCIVPTYPYFQTVGLGLFTIVILANYGWTRRVSDLCSQQSIIGIESI